MTTALALIQLLMQLPPSSDVVMMAQCEHGDLILVDADVFPIGSTSSEIDPFPPDPIIFIGTQEHAMIAIDILQMDPEDMED